LRLFLVLVALLALASCGKPLVPDDFTGPTAVIKDSFSNHVYGNLLKPDTVDFYVLTEVDGKAIGDALTITRISNSGAGFFARPRNHERRVPIKRMQLKLFATTYIAAPIGEIFIKTYPVERVVTFTPKPGGVYVVSGKLSPSGSRVWLQTEAGEIVAE
jgi:hypothetical protein